MFLFVAHAVKHNPQQQDASGHHRKAMPFKECLVLCVAYRSVAQRKFQPFTSIQTCNLDGVAALEVV
jgi:hypothetical protein